MLKGSTARRYAAAIFEMAVEEGRLDRWRDDLRTLAEYFGNRQLVFILREPKIAFARKESIVRDLLGAKLQPEALNLALLLVERELAELAPAIFTQFEQRYNDYQGLAVAQVTTAIPLDDALRAQITAELGQLTGKRILLRERVDPSILGGAIARVGDTLIDGSLRRRFALLRQQIASGSLGGPDDGTLAAILGGPNGGDGSGGQSAPTAPFVVSPADAGRPDGKREDGEKSGPGGAPSSATETAPRSSDSPHLAPRRQPPNRHGTRSEGGKSGDKRRR